MSGYTAPPYEPTSPVALFGAVPRFGHTDDLAIVVSGEETYFSYAMGIAFIPGLILCLFIGWLIMIAVFKALGKKVGILSGQKLKGRRPHWFVRGSVMISAAFALAAGSMYLVQATSSLYDTFYSIRNGAQNLSNLADDIELIAEDLIKSGDFTIPIRDNLVAMIENGVCSSFDTGSGIIIDVDPKAEQVVQILTDLNDFTKGELVTIKDDFSTQFSSIEEDVNSMLDDAQGYARISYYAIGIISLSAILYIGAYLAWFGPKWMSMKTYFCFQTYFVLPLYFLTILLTGIFTAAIGTTLVVNSDMCTSGENNDPESLLKAILDSQGITGTAREPVDHYIIDGCNTTFSGSSELETFVSDLESAYEVSSDLKQVISADITMYEQACNGYPGSLDPLLVSLDAVKLAIGNFLVVGYKAQSFLNCKRLNSIYIGLSHGAVCSHLPDTLAWMFCTMAIILFSGMVLFTFRAALLPDKQIRNELHEIDDVYENNYEPSVDLSPPPSKEFPRINTFRNYNSRTDPSVSTFTVSQTVIHDDTSVCTDNGSSADSFTGKPIQNLEENVGENRETSTVPQTSDNHDSRAQTAPATMEAASLNKSANTNDISEVEEEVEVTRLPTEDVDDVEIQVSQRNLVAGEGAEETK